MRTAFSALQEKTISKIRKNYPGKIATLTPVLLKDTCAMPNKKGKPAYGLPCKNITAYKII